MSDSELRGGIPRLCRLRTDRLTPVSKFDYVLVHTRHMKSHKLVASMVAELDDALALLQ
jgi:hypothetical protein